MILKFYLYWSFTCRGVLYGFCGFKSWQARDRNYQGIQVTNSRSYPVIARKQGIGQKGTKAMQHLLMAAW